MPQTKRPFICDCNEPAVKYDSCHNPICPRCIKLQSIRDMYGGTTSGVQDDGKDEFYGTTKGHNKRIWINEPDTEPIILKDCLARLERVLAQVSTAVDTKKVDTSPVTGVKAHTDALLAEFASLP